IGDTQLVDDPLDVHLDRPDAHKQALGDVVVRLALGYQPQHLELTLGQVVAVPGWLLFRRRLAGEPTDQLGGEFGIKWRLAAQDLPNGGHDFAPTGVLEYEP